MDKDRIKGTIDDAVGRAKRQAGEWTGDINTQAEGAAQQIKGKAEKTYGQVKDAVRDAHTEAERERQRHTEAEAEEEEAEHTGHPSHR